MLTVFWSKRIRKTRENRKTSNLVLTNLDQLKETRAKLLSSSLISFQLKHPCLVLQIIFSAFTSRVKNCIATNQTTDEIADEMVLYSVLFRFGYIRRWDQCAVYILFTSRDCRFNVIPLCRQSS